MVDNDFYFRAENISCCSLELLWKDKNREENANNSYEYKLYKNDNKIYQGKNTSFEVIDLNPNETYTFKIKIMKSEKQTDVKAIHVTTLKAPISLISENSIKVANGENIKYNNELSEIQKNIIKNCSKLIFDENEKNLIKGNFDGIEIKITHEDKANIYYISFDIDDNYFEEFYYKYIEECNKDIIIPYHFIIEKLPTILIMNILEKGSVILTGKKIGGAIASSLAFYLLYLRKLFKKENYKNSFLKNEKNCIGVVTFGSPSFLNKLSNAIYMMEFIPYFYNIKDEFDFFPSIFDFVNKENSKKLLNNFQKSKLGTQDKEIISNNIKNIVQSYNKLLKIPFGFYYKIDLNPIYENDFDKFYYAKSFKPNDPINDFEIYQNLKSETNFSKESLQYLENQDYEIEFIKIIRRNIPIDESMDSFYKENKEIWIDSSKGIIKFSLCKFDNNIISPDIIKQIELNSYDKMNDYIIDKKDIYYDNGEDITAYINNFEGNINKAIIKNIFGGKIKVKNIINIRGSGSTRTIIRNNIEKLFLFPFFKLFEILYSSYCTNENKGKYKDLKKENFGDNFEQLKILSSFENQIKTLNELLFLTRPDILGRSEKEIFQIYSNHYKNKDNLMDKQIKNNINIKLQKYYSKALLLQESLKVNCLDSQSGSIAKMNNFPKNVNGYEMKKLFMCDSKYFEYINLISQKFDDTYIKEFYIDKLIKEALQNIEKIIITDLNEKNIDECKKYLNEKIGKFYEEEIMPNVIFISILILSSIENGDEIKFNHEIDWEKINKFKYFCYFSAPGFIPFNSFLIKFRQRSQYEKDFKKKYSKDEIEKINMENLFYKIKAKNIINSNINSFEKMSDVNNSNNKILNFIDEKDKIGKEYYKKFLELLNNYSNEYSEDIEISIYDNLKETNKNREKNLDTIKEMMEDIINDEESKKVFLSLVRQSYLLGKLRKELVRI